MGPAAVETAPGVTADQCVETAARWERERGPRELRTLGTVRHFNLIVSRSAGLRRLLDEEPALAMRVLTDPRGRIQRALFAGLRPETGNQSL